MTALSKDRKTDQLGTPDNADPLLLALPVEEDTYLYAGSMVATNSSGYAVPASASSAQRLWGRCERDADNRTAAHGGPGPGTDAAINVTVRQGVFFFNNGTGINALGVGDVGSPVFASDDNTVNKTDNGGQWPYAGVMMPGGGPDNLRDTGTGEVAVFVGKPDAYGLNPYLIPAAAFTARNVATSLPGTFTVTSGVLLADANGALGAQDGVTNAVNDVIILPVGTVGSGTVTAANSGPWKLTAIGGASAKYAAIRPDWWPNAGLIVPGASIGVGGEGTLFGGTVWKTFAAGSVVIGTGDPLLYPDKVTQQKTLSAGTTTISNIPIRLAAKLGFSAGVAGGTPAATTTAYQIKLSGGITIGALGTAAVIVEAQSVVGTIVNTDVTVLNVTLTQ